MGKIIKYFFITLLSLVVLFIIAVFVVFVEFARKDTDESNNVKELTHSTLTQIITYHKKHGFYPVSLQELTIHNNQKFVKGKKEHAFRYYSYGKNRSKYVFSWRGGAMNWSGYSCTNDKSSSSKNIDGLVGTYTMSNETVCTIIDLH